MNKDGMNKDALTDTNHARSDTFPSDLLANDTQASRRRLLKGAAMGAPAILTLRSGALMAAGSCTGFKSDGGTPDAGDYCVQGEPGGTTGSNKKCPSNQIPKITSDGGLATQSLDISTDPPTTITDVYGNPIYTCPSEQPIVLSSSAYYSLTGHY